MIFFQLFLLMAFFINLGLGILVLVKNRPLKKTNLAFSLLAWASAGWAFSVFLILYHRDTPFMLLTGRLAFLSSSIIPAAFLYFTLLFPKPPYRVHPSWPVLIFLPAILFGLLSTSDLILKDIRVSDFGFETTYGPLHPFFSVYLLGYIFLGLFFLIRKFRYSSGVNRIQIKYFLLGMLITSGFGVTANLLLPMFGTSKYSVIGPSFTIIMVGFTTYSILKHRLMDINIVIKKGTTYIFLLLLLFIPSLLLILMSQKLILKEINYVFSVIMFLLLILVTLLFYRIKPKTERAVDQFLFKNRYNYRETLGEFSKALVNILDLQSLSKKIIETITETMDVPKASLFLLNDEKMRYDLFESKNITVSSAFVPLTKEAPLPKYLQKMKEIVIKDELVKGANNPLLKEIIEQMIMLEAEVSIPLISKGQLIGMINLSHKFNKDVYYQEDIDLLTMLANQAAIAVENARLFEDLKKSKSYIRRADRLASLGTLTAGLAHEIRNPLVAIKTLTQLLPERIDDEEFRNHFLSIAAGEVDRISHLVSELLDFARPSSPKMEFEDINQTIDGMILLCSTECKKKNIQIEKQLALDLPLIRVDREQIKQVFLNILLNAIEATGDGGKITVRTRSFSKPSGDRYLQVEIKDTGCGIPKEYLEEIFNPFYTTKATGSGLGLSISNQIVQDHKGYIDVESQQGKGSSFFINLPIDQPDHPRRRKSDQETQLTNLFEPR